MNIEEADICGAIEDYGRHIGAVHFVDSNRSAPGTGHLDCAAILMALKNTGYDNYLTVEMGPEFDTPDNARKAARYLHSLE